MIAKDDEPGADRSPDALKFGSHVSGLRHCRKSTPIRCGSVKRRPGKLITLRQKARVIKKSR